MWVWVDSWSMWSRFAPRGPVEKEGGGTVAHSANRASSRSSVAAGSTAPATPMIVPFGHPDYYAAQGAVQVLSGGMGSRLFTEVREKRNLCYAVWASYQTFKDRACVLAYAGTTNERAQETLDVTLGELRRLGEGIGDDELDRCKAGAKSSLIMQQESTRSRAGSLARDWYHLGRVRPLAEVRREIDGLTTTRVLDYVCTHPADDVTILTLGPKSLEG